jgi:hypothetical protein
MGQGAWEGVTEDRRRETEDRRREMEKERKYF